MTNETSRIHFRPWAGTNYEHGIGGKRLLALDESHYPDTDDPEQTQTVMKKLLANKQSQFACSATAFEEVLNEYGPDLIIAWGGAALFNNTPLLYGRDTSSIAHDNVDIYTLRIYSALGKNVSHPTYGYAWDRWHEAIAKFMA